eukprot:4337160-Alexandrium_andersonii.AAC.1
MSPSAFPALRSLLAPAAQHPPEKRSAQANTPRAAFCSHHRVPRHPGLGIAARGPSPSLNH